MGLCGTGVDHCCYFKGGTCPFVAAVDNPPYLWACSLRSELGSWDAVYNDNRYISKVIPLLISVDLTYNCGEYPPPGQTCGDCGATG